VLRHCRIGNGMMDNAMRRLRTVGVNDEARREPEGREMVVHTIYIRCCR